MGFVDVIWWITLDLGFGQLGERDTEGGGTVVGQTRTPWRFPRTRLWI